MIPILQAWGTGARAARGKHGVVSVDAPVCAHLCGSLTRDQVIQTGKHLRKIGMTLPACPGTTCSFQNSNAALGTVDRIVGLQGTDI